MSDDAQAADPIKFHHESNDEGGAFVLIGDAPGQKVGELPYVFAFAGGRLALEANLAALAVGGVNPRVVEIPFELHIEDGTAYMKHDLSALIKKA